ncbi:hypothetical protein A464_327 [Salmonella bongori N268-08]|uniref:Uncharacterized protein n=1 Tax=Salmonella bongori N268-08 TaxID=1197719 RepID=S5MSF6_SALBN|nr:hypothetical protein A464_327 [Salmonella bongori N268-08]
MDKVCHGLPDVCGIEGASIPEFGRECFTKTVLNAPPAPGENATVLYTRN